MRNVGLDEAQAGIKIARRNINNLKYADDNTFMAEIKDDTNRWRNIPYSWIGRINRVKNE